MPVALRAPGLIFGGKIGSGIDIWSFGCLIYEIITGTTLFCVSKFGADEQADDDHLVELNNIWNRFWTLGWKKSGREPIDVLVLIGRGLIRT